MSRKVRLLSALSVVALLLASCGGGDSSGRTKNSALCYETQDDKDAAVKTAQDAFDAAMGGGVPGDSISDTTVPETEDSVVETDDSVVDEAPSDTVLMESSPADGGGYRRPAVRVASSGDTTVPPAEDGGEVVLTVEQQQAQMDLEAAEAQPLCEEESESAGQVTCTAIRSGEGVTDDCAEGDVRIDDSNGGEWFLYGLAEDGSEVVLAQGTYDVTALGADNPITIPISYGGASAGEEESSTNNCSAIFTTTGVSWNCPNGELVVTSFDDNFDDNSWQVQSCLSEGSWNTADGQDFYFSVFRNASGERFLDGLNTEFPLDTEIPFTVPEDTEGICAEETDQETEIDWDSLPFSGQSDLLVRSYSFTVPEDLEEPVYVRFESSSNFDVDIDEDVDDFVDTSPCNGGCESYVGWSIWELAPGEYQFEIDENDQVVAWTSNVEIFAASSEFPKLPFNYSTDGSKTTFSFTIEETQVVTLTATSGQTCNASEDDEEENGFADPELDLYGSGVEEYDDNSGRGIGNCSAALLSEELEPGTYTVSVEDQDREGFAVTLGSSVELQLPPTNWDLETIGVTASTAIEFNIPAGGAWFRAEVFTNQLETYTYSDPELNTEIDSGGCANPDGDNSTDDSNCVVLHLVVLGGSEEEYESGSDEYEEVTQVDGNWLESYINSYGRSMEVFFPEGTYALLAWGEADGMGSEEPVGEFTLKYGFASLSLSDAIEIDVKPIDNPEIPTSSSSADVSTGAITSDGRISTAVASSVDELVCDTACIDDLFVKAGMTDGSIAISAGSEVVTVKKGQRGVLIPLGKNTDKISVTATSADGSQVVNLSSEIDQLSATEQSAFASVNGSSSKDSGFNLLYLLLLIPILGAVVFIIRRKQTVSISQ